MGHELFVSTSGEGVFHDALCRIADPDQQDLHRGPGAPIAWPSTLCVLRAIIFPQDGFAVSYARWTPFACQYEWYTKLSALSW
jgi:hypothetical protein